MAKKRKTKSVRKKKGRKTSKSRRAARLGLRVRREGRTADGKASLFRGIVSGHGGRVDLGVVAATNATLARRKLTALARRLLR